VFTLLLKFQFDAKTVSLTVAMRFVRDACRLLRLNVFVSDVVGSDVRTL